MLRDLLNAKVSIVFTPWQGHVVEFGVGMGVKLLIDFRCFIEKNIIQNSHV